MMASGRRPAGCSGRRGCACGSPSGVIILTGRWLMALTRQPALSLRFRRVWVREQNRRVHPRHESRSWSPDHLGRFGPAHRPGAASTLVASRSPTRDRERADRGRTRRLASPASSSQPGPPSRNRVQSRPLRSTVLPRCAGKSGRLARCRPDRRPQGPIAHLSASFTSGPHRAKANTANSASATAGLRAWRSDARRLGGCSAKRSQLRSDA